MTTTLPASPDLAAAYAEWDTPCLGDDWAGRAAQTHRLAMLIMAAPLLTEVGGLVVNTGGWSRKTSDRADAAGKPGSDAWYAALGDHEHATLTADGRGADRSAWCASPDETAANWVRYEGWTAAGCVAHGFVCGDCRKLVQTG
jgi:hypothetical protein